MGKLELKVFKIFPFIGHVTSEEFGGGIGLDIAVLQKKQLGHPFATFQTVSHPELEMEDGSTCVSPASLSGSFLQAAV